MLLADMGAQVVRIERPGNSAKIDRRKMKTRRRFVRTSTTGSRRCTRRGK